MFKILIILLIFIVFVKNEENSCIYAKSPDDNLFKQCDEENTEDHEVQKYKEESQKHHQNMDNVIVITVATSKTDGYLRYLRSAKQYGIEPITLGMGEEWKGGNVKYTTGGGFKVNHLKNAIEPYKDDPEKIIMFTDGYDVIFLTDLETVIQKFKETKARVLFSAEGSLWPDRSLASQYPQPKAGKRYLNSGAFMAYAPELWEILNDQEIKDDEDDQLFYTKIYLNEEKREKLKFQLDHTSQIFQNLYGAYDDLEVNLEEEPFLENTATKTRPSVLHGNGVSKIDFNSISNYLANSWSKAKGCIACQEDNLKLGELSHEKLPRVTIAIMVTQGTPFFEEALEKIYFQNYPRKHIDLFFYNSVEYHEQHIAEFIKSFETDYASIKQIRPEDLITERQGRNLALDHCKKKKCDLFFNVDAVAHLDNPDTLRLLIEQNRTVVAPMLVRPGKAWSNFWGAIKDDGFYERSRDYMEIVHNDVRGLWIVPFITNCYLINASLINQYDLSKLNYGVNLDPDMDFCVSLRNLEVFMYVSNRVDFGHLIEPDTFNTSLAAPDMYQMFENAEDWERRYIHKSYPDNLNLDNKPLQPCPDVYWFPITTLRFCKDLIHMMETFGKWSDGKNQDTRLEGGYEAVPTRDIHMNQVEWERHWLHFLQKYVRPLQESVFLGYYHDPPNSLMNFVVRYRPDEQPSLRPHHDSSTYTINIALNEAGVDYEGGGCRFIRYNCSVVDTKPGWVLMHPGRLTHFHEGLKVISGTRYIMISFVDP